MKKSNQLGPLHTLQMRWCFRQAFSSRC